MSRFELVATVVVIAAWLAFAAYVLRVQPAWLARIFVPSLM